MIENNITVPKKRGRKPKKYLNSIVNNNLNTDEIINSEEEKVIYHLPLDPNKIESIELNNIFIKPESNKLDIEDLNTSTDVLNTIININNNINKIFIYMLNFNKNTKCWWCKNTFNTPSIQLPENYSNLTFYCTGHFCSFNCVKSYNLDLNDTITFKRNSLINLLYYLTYLEHKNIIQAPHWLILEEFGGILSIEKFRENSIINTKEYLILHPPIISRQMQIEESYKINKNREVSIDKINKIYSDTEYSIKRSRPIQLNKFSLEETLGIIKTIK